MPLPHNGHGFVAIETCIAGFDRHVHPSRLLGIFGIQHTITCAHRHAVEHAAGAQITQCSKAVRRFLAIGQSGFIAREFCAATDQPVAVSVTHQHAVVGINQLWVADMTYVLTWEGFVYLAVVTDVFSRKVVGWPFCVHMTSDLVIEALDMAPFTRKPQDVIHHSDQGSQYTSMAFDNRCKEMGVRPSMGTVGDAYDNAMAESFFATLECELIARRPWQTKAQVKLAIFTWIETWYNPRRRHSGLGQMSPINFEKQHQEKQTQLTQPIPTQANQIHADADGLPTGCFAPVDKPTHVSIKGTSPCPQACPVDNPASVTIDQEPRCARF